MAEQFIAWVTGRPWWCLAAVVALVGVSAPGLRLLPRDAYSQYWFRDTDPNLLAFQEFEDTFGNDDTLVVVVDNGTPVLSGDGAKTLRDLHRSLETVDGVSRVKSLSNYIWVRAEGDDDIVIEPLLGDQELTPVFVAHRADLLGELDGVYGHLLSDDGTVAVLYAHLQPTDTPAVDYPVVYDAVQAVAQDAASGGRTVYVTGTAALPPTFRRVSQRDLRRVLPLAGLGLVVLLGFFFRRVSGVLVPLAYIVVCIVCTMGIGAWAGVRLHLLTSMVPTVLVAIGTADAVHLLSTFQKNAHRPAVEAAAEALRVNLRPTFLTSFTTAGGFFSLVQTDIFPIRQVGLLAGCGVLLAWVLVIFFFVPVLILTHRGGQAQNVEPPGSQLAAPFVGWMTRNHRAVVVVILGILTPAAAVLAARTQVSSDVIEYFSSEVPARRAYEFMRDRVGGVSGLDVVVDSGERDGVRDPVFLRRVRALIHELRDLEGVTQVASVLDTIERTQTVMAGPPAEGAPDERELPADRETIAQILLLHELSLSDSDSPTFWYSDDGSELRLSILWTRQASTDVIEGIERVETLIKNSSLDAAPRGKAVLMAGLDGYIVETFVTSLTITVCFLFVLMVVLFRSLGVAVLAMLPNVLPPLFGLAALQLLGRSFDVGTVLIGAVCLGIAVDDTIYFFSHYHQVRRAGGSTESHISAIFARCGRSLTLTSLILAGAFSAFALGDFLPNRTFGLLTALILLLALVMDLLLVPSLLLWIRGRNDAPSQG